MKRSFRDVPLTCVTCVTFSVTFWVRSLILLGAMISISVGEGGIILSEPKERVTWGMRLTARCLTRSESDVEFRTLDFRSAGESNFGNSVPKSQLEQELSVFGTKYCPCPTQPNLFSPNDRCCENAPVEHLHLEI